MIEIPEVFVSVESEYDLFYLTSEEKGSRSTKLILVENDVINNVPPRLRSKFMNNTRNNI